MKYYGRATMLDKIDKSKKLLSPVPKTWDRYWIDTDGNLSEIMPNGTVTRLTPCDGIVSIFMIDKYRDVRISNIVQLTFKPVFEEDFLFYLHSEVLHIDGNTDNNSASNIIWKLNYSHYGNGFYRIPGYSRYLINLSGEIYHREKNYFLTLNYSSRDYVTAYACPDYNWTMQIHNSSFVHRMMALAFIEYDADVCKMDVNHINGDKHNYQLDNLEWLSRRENIEHARDNNLMQDRRSIRVKNIKTGEVTDYKSQAECAKVLGLCPKTLSWRVLNGKGKVFEDTYTFESLAEPLNQHRTSAKNVIIVNLRTAIVQEVNSLAKAADAVGITVDALKKRYARNALTFGDWHLIVYSPALGENRPILDLDSILQVSAPVETHE